MKWWQWVLVFCIGLAFMSQATKDAFDDIKIFKSQQQLPDDVKVEIVAN